MAFQRGGRSEFRRPPGVVAEGGVFAEDENLCLAHVGF